MAVLTSGYKNSVFAVDCRAEAATIAGRHTGRGPDCELANGQQRDRSARLAREHDFARECASFRSADQADPFPHLSCVVSSRWFMDVPVLRAQVKMQDAETLSLERIQTLLEVTR